MKLEYSINKSIGTITLTNPPRNVLTHPVFEDLSTLTNFLSDPRLKGVFVEGAGRHFSAGADLEVLKNQLHSSRSLHDALNQGKKLLEIFAYATVPVISVIRGSCLGAGLEIALACHFRVASENALFGFPEANHGWIPAFSGTIRPLEIMRRQVLIDLVLSGRLVGATEALKIGLVDEVTPTRELKDRAIGFLYSLIAERSHTQIRSILESIHNGDRLPMKNALRRETELFMKLAEKQFAVQEKLKN
jgi:enoyl-CoA hydratase